LYAAGEEGEQREPQRRNRCTAPSGSAAAPPRPGEPGTTLFHTRSSQRRGAAQACACTLCNQCAGVKILLIEDDAETADYVARGLEQEGHVIDRASTGPDGLFLAGGEPYDLMIIDRRLPGLDGLAIVKMIRSAGVQTPVLFLTTRSSIEDRVAGLDAGADDYLVKPFAFAELVARVTALGRRPRGTALGTTLKVGDLELDQPSRVVKRAGRMIDLQPRE